ncbi:MAG: virulence protein RhuM/Fic/DOC family protein [Saprospiraceae bacterium]|nr:virulence protein RhuM/Fic/DOC family protein [Saprospiraceae bacterium]MBK9378239.1 virulence protein RhuM/Fic/DOC family protein [Saprospiraceae bacterium]
MNTIELYKSSNGETQIEVRFENETVWLSLNQIAKLFDRDKSVISRHLKNIFSTEELDKNSVVAKNATTALDGKTYQVDFYNLDAIISIGYRVNSKQGTQFRIWATKRLKEYLIQGYSINQNRLKELNQLIQIIAETDNNANEISEAKGLLNILTKYTKSFILLNKFDSNNLELKSLNENITYEIDYKHACKAISELKIKLIEQKEATELFGNQKDMSFEGILKSITQTFDGIYLYQTIEEQASNLLYFTIKNHPFSDGNKRIGAFLFVWFLEKNKYLLRNNGENKINDNALIALALLVAQSNPNEKELMIKLICNLINT